VVPRCKPLESFCFGIRDLDGITQGPQKEFPD
jgi:hypothetical protein